MLQGLSTKSLARRSAQRPWTTIGIWVVILVVAIGLMSALLADALTTRFDFINTPESQRGVDLIEEMRGVPFSTNEVVIIRSDKFTVDDSEFEQFTSGVFDDLPLFRDDRLLHLVRPRADVPSTELIAGPRRSYLQDEIHVYEIR